MSLLLVALQFALILLLAFPLPALLSPTVAALLFMAGLMLGLWTLYFNRIGNFNIRPEPKELSKLVTSGPYRFVRHPMYVAVLLAMAPFGLVTGELLRALYWLLLLAVLWKKALVEEAMLRQHFNEYSQYMQLTGRFLPRLFRSRKGR